MGREGKHYRSMLDLRAACSCPLTEVMDAGWAKALAPVEPQLRVLADWLFEEEAAGRSFLPSASQVLRAFQRPFDEVRVLVVGQDPYPTPGHAVGLSFSVAPGVALPRSLKNMFMELHEDTGVFFPTTGDLTPWEQQGVLLLNRVLTVEAHQAGSHRNKGWELITQAAVDALVARNRPLVAVLWGNDAKQLKTRLANIPFVESAHPSPLSARRGFFGSRPFSRVNALLTQMGEKPIDWRLG